MTGGAHLQIFPNRLHRNARGEVGSGVLSIAQIAVRVPRNQEACLPPIRGFDGSSMAGKVDHDLIAFLDRSSICESGKRITNRSPGRLRIDERADVLASETKAGY